LAQAVIALTRTAPPNEATHWTAAAMAKEVGTSISSVQRIWRVHKLQPHRLRSFKLSRDLQSVAELQDIVRFYVDPPAMPSCFRSMKEAKSRRSIAPNPACR